VHIPIRSRLTAVRSDEPDLLTRVQGDQPPRRGPDALADLAGLSRKRVRYRRVVTVYSPRHQRTSRVRVAWACRRARKMGDAADARRAGPLSAPPGLNPSAAWRRLPAEAAPGSGEAMSYERVKGEGWSRVSTPALASLVQTLARFEVLALVSRILPARRFKLPEWTTDCLRAAPACALIGWQ